MSAQQLEMRWFPVVDDRGRRHMEARWVVIDAAADAAAHDDVASAA